MRMANWRRGAAIASVALPLTLVAQDAPQPRHRAGHQVLRVEDAARSRPIQLDVWYPTTADEAAHTYGLSRGRVARDAATAPGVFPAILLSHGALGAATNYSWIAERLARSGFLAIGVSHFGESPVFGQATVDPSTVSHFRARTLDLSFALDFVLQRSKWATAVDGGRVAALGHSSGGATVAMLAGGLYRPQGMAAHCSSPASAGDKGCAYPVGSTSGAANEVPATDSRIRAVVLLDPAVGPGFDRDSLAGVRLPALVIGSTDNDFVPYASHAGRYAALLPKADVMRLDRGEGHFVYVDECSAPIEALGVPLCTDRSGVGRGDVHARLGIRILEFLDRHFTAGRATPGPAR
jgi:predicted dienelactone hydrolase